MLISLGGAALLGTGSYFIRRQSRGWWLVLTTTFAFGTTAGIWEALRSWAPAIGVAIACGTGLALLLIPALRDADAR